MCTCHMCVYLYTRTGAVFMSAVTVKLLYFQSIVSRDSDFFFFEKQNLDFNNLLGEQSTRSKTQPSIIDLT